MIGKIYEKRSASEMFVYVNKDDGQYLGGTLLFNSKSEFLNDFGSYQGQKKFKKPCLHMVLSVLKDEPLSNAEWLEAAEIYLTEIGIDPTTFGWTAVKHTDTEHHHIHILATKNSIENKSWQSNYSVLKNIAATAIVEQKMNLNNRQSSNLIAAYKEKKGMSAVKKQPSKRQHQLKRMTEKNPEMANIFEELSGQILQTITVNKNIGVTQFKDRLAAKGIELDILTTSDKSKIIGLIYSHTSPKTNEKVSFKASEFGEAFLFKKLAKQRGFWNDLSAPAPPSPEFKTITVIKKEEDEPIIIPTEPTKINLPQSSITETTEESPAIDTLKIKPIKKIISPRI